MLSGFSLFSLFLENMSSIEIGGGIPTGRVEGSARVGFARMSLDESEKGVGLNFAIAGVFWDCFAVDVFSTSYSVVVTCGFCRFSTAVASRAMAVIKFLVDDVAIGSVLSGGSRERLGPRSSPFDSEFSATIW